MGAHTVNIRGRGVPIMLASDHDLQHYLDEVEAARDVQEVAFAVAPRVRVRTLQGLIDAGVEVHPDQLVPEVDANGHQSAGMALLHRLVQRGFVLSKADGRG